MLLQFLLKNYDGHVFLEEERLIKSRERLTDCAAPVHYRIMLSVDILLPSVRFPIGFHIFTYISF